jgi:hypothetical protein
MNRPAALFKLLGSAWLTLGLICLVLGGLQISQSDAGMAQAPTLSNTAGSPGHVFHRPWLPAVLLAWGLMSLVLGWNLVRLTSWAQPLAQTMHLLLAVYLAVSLLIIAPQAAGPSVLGALLLVGDLGLAYLLRGRLAAEVFSQVPLQTALVNPMRCEFCDSPLDRRTRRCPQCEPAIKVTPNPSDEPRSKPTLVGQLVSLADGTVYRLSSQRPTCVGRELSRNDINLSNPTVSRRHARIEYDVQNNCYFLTALQDTNGTFVNDNLIRRRTLRDGDEVRFGRAKFRFNIASGSSNNGGSA